MRPGVTPRRDRNRAASRSTTRSLGHTRRETRARWPTERPLIGPLQLCPRSPCLVHLPDGPNLDRPAILEVRHLAGQLNSLVEVLRLDHVEAAQLLLGFGKRPVREQALAVADSQCGG